MNQNVRSGVVNCTEFSDEEFVTSSFTGTGRWACVQVARREGVIAVRHSRDDSKTTLEYSSDEWQAFIDGVKKGEFDI